jgi:lipooligosaccharide transport system ATP-binding protein
VKKYGDFTAVAGIDFDILRGENLALLGPNGAGKSTTISMLYGFISITAGELEVLGHNIRTNARQAKARLGIVPQEENLDKDLSVRQQMIAYARYFRLPRAEAERRADELVEFAQLKERENEVVENLSGGMKRRLLIARALMNKPEILILDEPTTGLDPTGRHMIWQKLRQLKQEGITILLTTHYMDEAEMLSDRVIMINDGRIFGEGCAADLIREHAGERVVELHFAAGNGGEAARRIPAAMPHHLFGDTVYLYVSQDGATGHDPGAVEELAESLSPTDVVRRRASLEDVFLKLAGRTLRD